MRELPKAVGDTAYIMHGRSFGTTASQRVTTGVVTKISPSGQITVDAGSKKRRFTNRGWEISGGYRGAQLIDRETYDRFAVASAIAEVRAKLHTALEGLSRSRFQNKAETLAVLRKAYNDAASGLPEDEA